VKDAKKTKQKPRLFALLKKNGFVIDKPIDIDLSNKTELIPTRSV
jgi:hypothetical protein